jgi:hypothetical protein
MRRLLILPAVLAGIALAPPRSVAQDGAPAAAPSPYAVTPDAGPYLILLGSYFTGDNSKVLAEGLVEEIRSAYKLQAFVFNRGAEEKRREEERVKEMVRQQREQIQKAGLHLDTPIRVKKLNNIEEQYAVLVGGYKDMDAGRKALDELRKKPFTSERYMTQQTVIAPGPGEKAKPSGMSGGVSPFLTAFVVPNPSIPRQQEVDKDKPDPFLKELNAGEEYSLLKCPKSWTLTVKQYAGAVRMQPRSGGSDFLSKIGLGSKSADLLNASAHQAHSMAELLRTMGYDAYVLHTRAASFVTVGGFDGPKDPSLATMQRSLASIKLLGASEMDRLYANPVPMQIPRPQ